MAIFIAVPPCLPPQRVKKPPASAEPGGYACATKIDWLFFAPEKYLRFFCFGSIYRPDGKEKRFFDPPVPFG
jgi:hypothetical protein